MRHQFVTFYGLLISLITVFAGNCGPKFNGKCTCGHQDYNAKTQYVVNCTNTGFRNTDVLESMPLETEVVIFTGNYIPELPWNVFGAINDLVNLTIVDMSNNHIKNIRGKSYHHVSNVKRLILNHNNLSISRFVDDEDENNYYHPRVFSNFINLMELHLTNAFADNTSAELSENLHDIFVSSNLTKLVKLHLEQNEIKKFDDRRAFCDLPSLRDLHLGDNLLTEINFNISCIKKLRFLDLERNNFEFIKWRDLNIMDKIQNSHDRDVNLTIDLTYNPFTCECGIYDLYNWLPKTKVTVRNHEDYTCYRTKRHEELITTLNMKHCASLKAKHQHRAALTFVLVLLSFILLGLIGGLIYISKDRIKPMISQSVQSVAKKVQYTTIKDDDAPEQYV